VFFFFLKGSKLVLEHKGRDYSLEKP